MSGFLIKKNNYNNELLIDRLNWRELNNTLNKKYNIITFIIINITSFKINTFVFVYFIIL